MIVEKLWLIYLCVILCVLSTCVSGSCSCDGLCWLFV